jgi:hypothetical protein
MRKPHEVYKAFIETPFEVTISVDLRSIDAIELKIKWGKI